MLFSFVNLKLKHVSPLVDTAKELWKILKNSFDRHKDIIHSNGINEKNVHCSQNFMAKMV